MLTGQAFRLKREILAMERADDSRRAIYVPIGEMVTVQSGPRPDDKRLVEICWSDKKLVVFLDDLTNRGEPVVSKSSC